MHPSATMSGRMVDTVPLGDRGAPVDGDHVAPGSAIDTLSHRVLERKTELDPPAPLVLTVEHV